MNAGTLRSAIFVSVFCFMGLNVTSQAAVSQNVSYHKHLVPILKRSCTGCHHPGKLKADLDLTTFTGMIKGGKHGLKLDPANPSQNRFIEEITGPEPSMPKEGDPLTKDEVQMFVAWIKQGAKDDTPESAKNPFRMDSPPRYSSAPVVSALAFSPTGSSLAVSGFHETLILTNNGAGILARLVGDSPRIESLCYSPDGSLLAVAGGAPALFGELQLWDAKSFKKVASYRLATDSIFGVSFSPDGKRVGFGCADKSVRIISTDSGKELVKFDNHSDWTLATTFTMDGTKLLSGSRDKAMKLLDSASGQFIDDINKLLEGVLCLSRHPKKDQVIYGGDQGTPRIYRMAENQGRTAANNDSNLLREFERQPAAVLAVAYDKTGTEVAVGGAFPEVKTYSVETGKRLHELKGHSGAVFCLAYHPVSNQLYVAGFDGKIRAYDTKEGKLAQEFIPVPISR